MKKATGKEAWDHLDYELKKRSTYKGLAALANDGDPACAEKMVRLAYFYVGHSKDMPEDIRNYLRRCLGRIIKGTTPNRAFNYEREGKRGAPANFTKMFRAV
jgi:hypothetical protein